MVQYVYNPFTQNFDAVSGTGSGGGTITAVGDVTSGDAFTGTQGSELTSETTGFTIQVQGNTGTGNGGNVNILSGAPGSVSGTPGNINLTAANSTSDAIGGSINLTAGTGGISGTGGSVTISGGIAGTAGSAGGTLNFNGGDAKAGVTNQPGGQILSEVGSHTGNALPALYRINGSRYISSSGTTASISADRIVTNAANPFLTNTVQHTIIAFTMGSALPLVSGTIFYSVEARETATGDVQVCSGQIGFVASFNLAGISIAGTASQIYPSEISSTSTGTISSSWAFVSSGLNGAIAVTATSAGLGAVDSLVVYYTLMSNTQGHVSITTS